MDDNTIIGYTCSFWVFNSILLILFFYFGRPWWEAIPLSNGRCLLPVKSQKLQLPALVLASPYNIEWGVLYREEPHQCESHLLGAGAFFQGLNLFQIPPTFYFSPKISIRFFQILYPEFIIIICDRVSPTQATEKLLDLNIFHLSNTG